MKKDKVTKKIIFVKKCPLFRTKCKMNECAFFRHNGGSLWSGYIGKKVISKIPIKGCIETKFSAKGLREVWHGVCAIHGRQSEVDVARIERITIYGKRKIKEETYTDFDYKSKPWWKFW